VPVAGIHWYAAARFARSRGLALPTAKEFVRAATAGLPWAYPWGNRFEADRVTTGMVPAAIGRRPQGASLHHIEDLSGNVDEFLAADQETRLFAAGGSYKS
jgi:formylglycine-generating enzyme required for sulfatase activity